jgi:hypothetical protein
MNESILPLTVRWNQLALRAIAATNTSPPLAARQLALLHTAIFDAWSVYDQKAISTSTARYIKRHQDCSEGDMPTAISYAAFRVLTYGFWTAMPADDKNMFCDLMNVLGYDPDDASFDVLSPQGIGNLVAHLVLDARSGDGANQNGIPYHAMPWTDVTMFHPKNEPSPSPVKDVNLWQPLRNAQGQAQHFLTAHWPLVRPFALKEARQFRPPPPYNTTETPAEFRRQAEEIYDLGQTLSPEQKAIAEYWAQGPGTITIPGHWCEIAQYVAGNTCKDYSEEDCVKLFFVLANALLDASIACWEAKRKYEAARPVTVIRSFLRKKDWNSFLPTPPYPGHVSAHSAISRAAAVILQNFTGSDEFGAAGVFEKGASLMEPGLPSEDILFEPWENFTAAAEQAGLSRLYAGVQFRRSNEEGQRLGAAAGACAWQKAGYYFNDK